MRRLEALENYLHYPQNQNDTEALKEQGALLFSHGYLQQEIAATFAQEFTTIVQGLGNRLSLPLNVELWNEPNAAHGEGGIIPRLRPACYAELIRQTDHALTQAGLTDQITLLLGATFGPPPQVFPYDSSPDYLAEVLKFLGPNPLVTSHDWSAHLYPGPNPANQLLYRTNRLLEILRQHQETDLSILEVGYTKGERFEMGGKTQQACWGDILATYYPLLADGRIRQLQLFNFDWQGDGDFSYPQEEPDFSFSEASQMISR